MTEKSKAEEKGRPEDELMKHIQGPNMDKQTLRYYSDFISRLQKQNLKLERIWWDGIPWPDILVAETRVSIKNFGNLSKIFEVPFGRLEVFPLGIPFPEELLVQIKTPRFNQNVAGGQQF